ncbi:unnamed protein product [Dibothriocephalus latus]|uniref:PWWP domain-containing protein n=1 Tax=Dibothriocephalus latus TaxID=60516 RepID=A0A3P7LA53_DIBLA|nr:unnamed protein product [Dibothriocephalus latus]
MKQPEEDDFCPGSIHWAKVGSHPWWPCIIHNSPNGEGFVKLFKTCEKYHVQFLGPVVERAWVSSFNLIPYQTHQNLERQLKDLQAAWPQKKPKTSEDREFDLEIHRLIASPAPYRFQPVCPVCEVFSSAPGQMLKCKGVCGQIMHPHCMRYKEPPPAEFSYMLQLWLPPPPSCLLVLVKGCGRHFHRDCLHQHPGCLVTEKAGGAVLLTRCPAHVCATCCLEDPESTAIQPEGRPMLQCVRCPRVFHTGDLCTPAGSVEVSLSHIVCPAHFVKNLSKLPQHKVQSISWCFRCRKPGPDRVFCETCPTNYHKACMDPADAVSPSPTFTCDNCRRGVQPRYAQVIWAKIPCFRWWP